MVAIPFHQIPKAKLQELKSECLAEGGSWTTELRILQRFGLVEPSGTPVTDISEALAFLRGDRR